MQYRYDMQGKTPQQRAIVSQRDRENEHQTHSQEFSKSYMVLAVDKDTCPVVDNIIFKDQCRGCENYIDFIMANGIPCVKCSNN